MTKTRRHFFNLLPRFAWGRQIVWEKIQKSRIVVARTTNRCVLTIRGFYKVWGQIVLYVCTCLPLSAPPDTAKLAQKYETAKGVRSQFFIWSYKIPRRYARNWVLGVCRKSKEITWRRGFPASVSHFLPLSSASTTPMSARYTNRLSALSLAWMLSPYLEG